MYGKLLRFPLLLNLALALLPGFTLAQPAARALPTAAVPTPSGVEFIENKGQWDAGVRFAVGIPNGRLFLRPTGLSYNFCEGRAHHHGQERAAQSRQVKAHAYNVAFEGAQVNEMAGLQPLG